MNILIILLLSYLAGSLPTAIIAGRLILKDDIRHFGSQNAGATNVFRVMGWKPALIVLLIDIAKGVAAVLLIAPMLPVPWAPVVIQICAGLAAIMGHVYTVFAGFRGGKGVGTAFGVLLSLAPVASLITFAVWLILVLITRIVSVGSLAAGVVFPLTLGIQRLFFQGDIAPAVQYLSLGLGVLIFITHRTNIGRLIRGEEKRLVSSKQKPAEE